MPRDRTPEEGVPLTTRITRTMGGRGKDVSLPMPPGGRRDPRLPREVNVSGQFKAAGRGLATVRELGKRR